MTENAEPGQPAPEAASVPELIADRRNGLLFPAGDDAALADRFNRLLADRRESAALGAVGRALVRERFDTRAMADKYLRHYRDLLRSSVRA